MQHKCINLCCIWTVGFLDCYVGCFFSELSLFGQLNEAGVLNLIGMF